MLSSLLTERKECFFEDAFVERCSKIAPCGWRWQFLPPETIDGKEIIFIHPRTKRLVVEGNVNEVSPKSR